MDQSKTGPSALQNRADTKCQGSLGVCHGSLLTTVPYLPRPATNSTQMFPLGKHHPPDKHTHTILSLVCLGGNGSTLHARRVGEPGEDLIGLNLLTSSVLPSIEIGAEKVTGLHGTPDMQGDVLSLGKRFFSLK